jgi:hypothetical protein
MPRRTANAADRKARAIVDVAFDKIGCRVHLGCPQVVDGSVQNLSHI